MILRTVKAVPEYGKGKSRHSAVGGEDGEVSPPLQTIPDENENQVLYPLGGLPKNLPSLYKAIRERKQRRRRRQRQRHKTLGLMSKTNRSARAF